MHPAVLPEQEARVVFPAAPNSLPRVHHALHQKIHIHVSESLVCGLHGLDLHRVVLAPVRQPLLEHIRHHMHCRYAHHVWLQHHTRPGEGFLPLPALEKIGCQFPPSYEALQHGENEVRVSQVQGGLCLGVCQTHLSCEECDAWLSAVMCLAGPQQLRHRHVRCSPQPRLPQEVLVHMWPHRQARQAHPGPLLVLLYLIQIDVHYSAAGPDHRGNAK
mmetsp:Transcript_11806/g.26230  ORF Transcript_11806/g.26230 Transcript_11806/m.26230 type:complete len:217 (-) Transcript_11806:261-911(-)